MTGRVVEEVSIVRREECGVAERRHARATGVAQVSGLVAHARGRGGTALETWPVDLRDWDEIRGWAAQVYEAFAARLGS